MTPKEKALELYWKYYNRIEHTLSEEYSEHEKFLCKECALIAVDEIINSRNDDRGFDDTLSSVSNGYYTAHPMYFTYWQEVNQEIKKL